MKKITFCIFLLASMSLFSQTKKVLIYHETNEFRHGSISNGITMITNQGNSNGLWTVDDSQNSSVFTAANLAQYDAVIFLNTSGSDETGSDGDLLSASEKAAFENFIINGGGFVGIHAATDTYRDGVWPFYNELVGGIVQTGPNHTSNNYNATMTIESNHPAVDFLGTTWTKPEEYYYWEQNGGQLSNDNTVVLEVESTGGNSYDAARPIAWYKQSITVSGTTYNNLRSFYTALGHNGSDYNGTGVNNVKFQSHIEEAIKWAIGETSLGIEDNSLSNFKVFPNPLKHTFNLQFRELNENTVVKIYDVIGKLVYNETILSSNIGQGIYTLDLSSLRRGIYMLSIRANANSKTIKIVKN